MTNLVPGRRSRPGAVSPFLALQQEMNRLFEAAAIQKGIYKLLIDVPTALLTVLFGLILLTLYSPWFSVFAIVVVAILYLIMRWTGPEGLETSIVESKYKYKAVHWLEEMARAFHAFKYAGDSTLPVEIYSAIRKGFTPEINAVSAIIILVSMGLMLPVARQYRFGGAQR